MQLSPDVYFVNMNHVVPDNYILKNNFLSIVKNNNYKNNSDKINFSENKMAGEGVERKKSREKERQRERESRLETNCRGKKSV